MTKDTKKTPTEKRSRLRLGLMLAGPILLLAGAAYFYLTSGRYQSTDDAYVQSAQVAISADVNGRVQEVDVHDNQFVHKGDVLFRLKDKTFQIAVAEAKAKLAAAKLKVEMLKANYRQAQSDLASAQDTLKFRQTEYNRQKRLYKSGVATKEKIDDAMHALKEARTKVNTEKQQIGAVLANLAGNPDIPLEQHPEVQQAQAPLDRALLDLSYTVVRAPTDGVVTRVDELQAGSYIKAAKPVFALVSTHDVWIQANFKEDQLAHLRPGQSATISIDTYDNKTFAGRVASVSPGTGSQFSLLPPENATGNWVKVVQRLPVRIKLDHIDPSYPLHAGLSANVSVDTCFQRHLFKTAEARPVNTLHCK